MSPPTIVYTTCPFSFFPINGVFFDFDTILSFVYVYSILGSNIVRSATALVLISPLSIFNNFAGLYDISLHISKYVILPVFTSAVIVAGSAVSNPIIPFGAEANPFAFSSSACGAWSVIIASIVPVL